MTEIGATFRQPFIEQVEAWQRRLQELRPTATWTDVPPEFHDRGFMVAGATKAELLADLAGAVEKAIRDGMSLDQFRADFRTIVVNHGWHGWTGEGSAKGEAWRTRVIYRTNIATTYAAGRRAQLVAGGFKFWVYKHGLAREPRLQHLAWDGIALPPDHPFWAAHCPPNGWGCTCRIRGANGPASIRLVGGDPGKQLPRGWDSINPKTGAPVGIDKGWDYAPGASNDHLAQTLADKAAEMPAPLGGDLAGSIRAIRSPTGGRGLSPVITGGDLDAVAGSIVDSGLALKVGTTGMAPAGLAEFAQGAMEAQTRFGLPPLRYLGGPENSPFPTLQERPLPPAYYDVIKRSIILPPETTDAKALAATLGLPLGSAAFRYREQLWRSGLDLAAPAIREIAAGMAYPGWVVNSDIRSVAIHEAGHVLHYNHRYEIDDLLKRTGMFEEGWPLLLSSYASENPFEMVAEAFALYLLQPDNHHRLHPEMSAWLGRMDRWNR